jgi:ATP-dependent protease ClpP protease subunit
MAELLSTLGKRAPDGTYEIPILGDIGFFGTNGEDLIREIRAVKPSEIKFIIYSPGGAVYDAIAVAGYVREQGIKCYAEIYGVCASAATVFAALAGPKNTAIAPGSMFLVHMPYGGDEKAIDNAEAFLVDLYVTAYGWTKAEAKAHMRAEEGRGILWNTTEAKKFGVVSEIMEGAKVAAHFNIKKEVMAEDKKTVQVPVKLSTFEAIRAAMGEGTTVDVEVEQIVAEQLSEREQTIKNLKEKLAEMEAEEVKAKEAFETAKAEAIKEAKQEATQAKADLDTLNIEHEDVKAENERLKAQLEKVVPPPSVIANDPNAPIAAVPGQKEQPTPGEMLIKAAFKQANPLQLAQAKMQTKNNK